MTIPRSIMAGSLVLAAVSATAPSIPDGQAIDAEMRRLAATAGGVVGVAAWRLDGHGTSVLLNADEAFPMASTFKVAVAGTVLAKIDRRELALDQMIAIAPEQMIASDIIANRLIHPGVTLSIHNLIELMLTESDNTATDVLVTAAAGPQAVTAWVQGQGIRGLRVDDATDGIVRRFYGLPREGAFPTVLEAATKANPALADMTEHPNPAFDDDPRDTSTPRAMGELLTRIFNGKALSAAGTEVLVGAMERCRTGGARLRGLMPTGTVVADKTGTIGGTVNDAGVVTLPDGAGRIAIVVFVKKSDVPVAERERAIAEIGRSIRDYYLFQAR